MPLNDEEGISLILKTIGVENFEAAAKVMVDLRTQAQSVASPIDQAKEALVETSDVTSRLADTIVGARNQIGGLGSDFRAGLIEESEYIAKSNELISVIREKQMVIDRLSGDEEGGIGFKGLASNIRRGEIALNSLITGQGLARAGPMLDPVLVALGGPAGLGIMIGAVALAAEKFGPALAKYFDIFDAKKIAEAAAEVKKFAEESKALTTADRGDVEKTLAKEFKNLASQGIDIAGSTAGAIEASQFAATPTEKQARQVEMYNLTLPGSGQRALMEFTGLAISPEDLKKELNEANVQRAQKLISNAVVPGVTGKNARTELRMLANGNPGAFPPEFSEFLKDLDETPEAAVAAEADIEANDPDQQYMERHKEALAKGRIQNERTKAMDDAVGSQNTWNNAYDKSQASAAKKAEHAKDQAELKALEAQLAATKARGREQVKADREADAEAKASTPEHLQREAMKEERGQALGLVQQNTHGFDALTQGQIAKHLEGNHQAGLDMSATFEQALAYAIMQTREDIARGIQAGMKRQAQYSESFYTGP